MSRNCEKNIFRNPEKYRSELKKFLLDKSLFSGYSGKNSIYVFPTKYCPNECEHCYFSAPLQSFNKSEGVLCENSIEKIVEVTRSDVFEKMVITGGGEPMLEERSVLKLIRESDCETIMLHTSGVTFTPENISDKIDLINSAVSFNEKLNNFILRVSVDEFHKKKVPLLKIVNLINEFASICLNDSLSKMSLVLHSIFEDSTINELVDLLSNPDFFVEKKIVDVDGNIIELRFNTGFSMKLDYSVLFNPKCNPDMSDSDFVKKNIESFESGRVVRPYMNLDVSENEGFCYCVYEDGSVELWNSAPSDNVQSILYDDYYSIRKKIFSDIIYQGLIRNDMKYIESIISEVNSSSVDFAKVVNSATFYLKRATFDKKTLLYLSLRILQDFILNEFYEYSFLEKVLSFEVINFLKLDRDSLRDYYFSA